MSSLRRMRAPLVVALHYLIFTLYGTNYAYIQQAGANLAPQVEKAATARPEETQASSTEAKFLRTFRLPTIQWLSGDAASAPHGTVRRKATAADAGSIGKQRYDGELHREGHAETRARRRDPTRAKPARMRTTWWPYQPRGRPQPHRGRYPRW